MTTPIMISLDIILAHSPCEDGWLKILEVKGGSPHDKLWPLSDALESNGLDDTLWALRCLPQYSNLCRKYAVWCARPVQHLMTEPCSRAALDVAWEHSEGRATDEELAAARAAAGAAAWAAARAAQKAKLKKILDAGEWVE